MTHVGDSPSSIPDMSGSSNATSSSSTTSSSSPEVGYTHSRSLHMSVLRLPLNASSTTTVDYPPRIPVAFRHPRFVASVKQYRSEAQQQQLQHFIVSESFIPVTPDSVKQPRRRRRPPFSYSSLIAQAILGSEDERMTLQEIYKWIMGKYPALCDANDTGWQNTIRHNLSLNSCFKKIPKVQMDGLGPHGKGGYWTVDPSYTEKFKNESLARGVITTARQKEPREIKMNDPEEQQQQQQSSSSLSSSQQPRPQLLALPVSPQPPQQKQKQKEKEKQPQSLPLSISPPSSQPLSLSTTTHLPLYKCVHTPAILPSPPLSKRSSQVMQIQHLLN